MSQISRKPRSEQTRRQILAAAERRFAEQSYAATRLEDIGADVGMGRSAVIYHFADKHTLYAAVLEDLFGGALDVLRRSLAGSGDLPTRIENAVRAAVAYVVERPAAARIAMREATSSDPALRAEIQRRAAPILDLIQVLFEEGERVGAIRADHTDPLRFVSFVSGTTLFYVAALPTLVAPLPYAHLSPDAVEALQRDLVEVTRRLLGIRGPRLLNQPKETR
ncbi:MAG: TetR/AcrR family transcriptional regulator [Proteobacteria bacterium]|nr:TetR/AcrR family transcriptional regulator [Pseudomonadota bacterium]